MEYNIEFAHIYADKNFSTEQEKSISVLKSVIKKLDSSKKSYSTVILIDEFSHSKIILNKKEFIDSIRSTGVPLDFLAYESKLSRLALSLINEIDSKLVKEERFGDKKVLLLIKDHKKIGLIDKEGFPTCSLLIAAWILCRLGVYKVNKIESFSSKSFPAKKLITILPKKYKETEQKVLDILASTKFASLIKGISYKFF